MVLFTVLSIVLNNYAYLKSYVNNNYSLYQKQKQNRDEINHIINDDSFYRMDKDYSIGRCDPLLYNYRGITNYASSENVKTLSKVKQFGSRQAWMWSHYTSNMPYSSEKLLGLKYVITSNINDKPYENIGEMDEGVVYKNSHALPVIFPVTSFDNNAYDELNNFEYQNNMWKSLNNIDEDVFIQNAISFSSKGTIKNVNISVLTSGSVYLYLPSYAISGIVNVTENKNITYNQYETVYYIGEYTQGDVISLEINTEDEMNQNLIASYSEQKEVIEKNADLINDHDIHIEEVSSSHLEIEYIGNAIKIATTIPYDEGWSIYDNGQKVEIQSNWDSFISFELGNQSNHKIKMVYYPKGLKTGIAISSLSLLILAVYVVYDKKKRV